MKLELGPNHRLAPETVAAAAADPRLSVSFSPQAIQRIRRSRKVIERMVAKRRIVYGVTTGFGNFKDKCISAENVPELQENLIRSHAAGVGELFPPEIVRAALIVRLNSLSQGFSGVRLELVEAARNLLNRGVTPVVPSQGSVGSSGDLAPLSHMGLVLMGEGKAWYGGKLYSGGEALRRAHLKPIQFAAKEGLAWTNGTSVMTGIAALAVDEAKRLVDVADIGCALTLEAVCGASGAFDARVHAVRPHPGQAIAAERIRNAVAGSRLVDSVPSRVQDSYSLRCAAQVHGAARDAIRYAAEVVELELNAATDNPLIFTNPDEAVSGGNFHGEPIAIAMDMLAIAVAELANISERRTAKLVDSATNEGLPMFLIPPEKAGLHNGFMIAQYTAAALVSENKVLAHPASVDSIPTSANQEDHVSMGTIAARKALQILKNAENVLAIEFIVACQAIDFRTPGKLGKGTKKAYKSVRKISPFISKDKELASEIAEVRNLLFRRANIQESKRKPRIF